MPDMTADQLIQNARDTAQRLFPQEPEQRAAYEAEMLRRYLREMMGNVRAKRLEPAQETGEGP